MGGDVEALRDRDIVDEEEKEEENEAGSCSGGRSSTSSTTYGEDTAVGIIGGETTRTPPPAETTSCAPGDVGGDGSFEPSFEPIRSPQRAALASVAVGEEEEEEEDPEKGGFLPRPRSTRSVRSISRVRSNIGYGCDEEGGYDEEQGVGGGGGGVQPDGKRGRAGGEDKNGMIGRGLSSAERDPYEVSFENGDLDPDCPRSMGAPRKWLIVCITSFGSFCVTCASSIYTSSYTQMNAELGSSNLVATLGLSTFVLGLALGPAWSPLSEFYGRRPIYLGSFALFTLWIVPSAVAKNIETMIVARFFQGFTGSAFLSVSGGTVGDLFAPRDMALPMAIFTISPFAGPSMGPLLGGFLNTYVDWRWTHYVLIITSFALLVAVALFVPETYHPVLLRNKAARLRKETGDPRWRAPIEKLTRSIPRTVGRSLLRPFQLLFFEPICAALDVYSAILLGILYLFFGAFPLVFRTKHGFSLWQTGLTFMGLLAGMVLAIFTNPAWVRVRGRLVAQYEAETGVKGASEPEFHLPCVIAGSVLIPIGLFWFGWTTFSWVHWIVPIIGSGVFGAGTILVFKGIFTYLVDAYPTYAASALAANVFVRCAFAAAFPLFGIQMYDGLGYQWATSLLGFLTVAMLPFPFIFFYYGKTIRGKSQYAAA